MNAFEIKNWQQLVVLVFMTVLLLLTLIGLPNLMTWISWNALVGDLFNGPYISFVQALPLTLSFFGFLYLSVRPQIQLEIHKANSSEEAEVLRRQFEAKKKTNDTL